jgi:transcriptional regulator with XRE-family HTH domain
MSAATLIRDTRHRHRLSQRSLALRAGTTQAWVSAIESGRARPSVEVLRRLLLVMGEELVLECRPLPTDFEHDPIAFADARRRDPDDRLEEALAWMRLSLE